MTVIQATMEIFLRYFNHRLVLVGFNHFLLYFFILGAIFRVTGIFGHLPGNGPQSLLESFLTLIFTDLGA